MSERSMEEEYFKKLEDEQRERLRVKLEQQNAALDLEERRKLHYNKCGKCGASMDTQLFRGLEIELCPECGAVLLDPGELEVLAGQDQTGVFSSFFSIFGKKKEG